MCFGNKTSVEIFYGVSNYRKTSCSNYIVERRTMQPKWVVGFVATVYAWLYQRKRHG